MARVTAQLHNTLYATKNWKRRARKSHYATIFHGRSRKSKVESPGDLSATERRQRLFHIAVLQPDWTTACKCTHHAPLFQLRFHSRSARAGELQMSGRLRLLSSSHLMRQVLEVRQQRRRTEDVRQRARLRRQRLQVPHRELRLHPQR